MLFKDQKDKRIRKALTLHASKLGSSWAPRMSPQTPPKVISKDRARSNTGGNPQTKRNG